MNSFRRLLASLILSALVACGGKNAAVESAARVNDAGGMLSEEQESTIRTSIEHAEEKAGIDVVVVTIPSLDGKNLIATSIKVAQEMDIEHRPNAAVIFISDQDKKIRIETGKTLSNTVTTQVTVDLIKNMMLPEFRAGNYAKGINDVIVAMEKTVLANKEVAKEMKELTKPRQ